MSELTSPIPAEALAEAGGVAASAARQAPAKGVAAPMQVAAVMWA